MAKKLYVLGIDGLSYEYISKNLDSLPNFGDFIENGKGKILHSIFPPDSIPAWITIYTGLSPAAHGILDSIDYLNPKDCENIPKIDKFKGKTFWDKISASGRKVCVVNPFLAFPVWDVNGFFVNGSVFAENKVIDANDNALLEKYPAPNLGGLTSFPQKHELTHFIRESFAETKELFNYSKLLHASEDYDLFFATYFTMDRYQHFLWRYTDRKDVTYPGKNVYENSILNLYKYFDKIVGEIKNNLKKDEALIIISDHGHCRRCTKVVNINEILRKSGFFVVELAKFKYFDRHYLIEILKNNVMHFVYKFNLEDLFYEVSKLIPGRKSIKRGGHLKKSKSIAEASSLFGTNPFGAIKINNENIASNSSYDEVRNKIILMLLEYKWNGTKVFKWVKKREDVLQGEKLDKYDDILFELDPEYGVNWAVFTNEVGINATHKKISGGHNQKGCFFVENLDDAIFNRISSVEDIYNLIIGYFKQ